MSVCVKCGAELNENAKFCVNCGTPQIEPAAEEKKEDAAEQVEVKSENAAEPAEEAAEVAPDPEITLSQPVLVEEVPEEKPAPVVITAAPPPPPVVEAPKPTPAPKVPVDDPEKPKKKSKWGIISTWGYVGIDLLMAIPVIGFILTIIWACGGCRKYAKRNYARSRLIYFIVGILLTVVLALVVRFVFPELIVTVFETMYPGYTIVF